MNIVNPEIEKYAADHSTKLEDIFDKLAAKTHASESLPQMLVGPLEGSFLAFMTKAIGAKRVLEIGTFTGYSAMIFAKSLPNDGEVHTLDLEEKSYTREFWKEAGVEHKIHLHLGDAAQTLGQLKGEFDLIFIDADKVNYQTYLNEGLKRLSRQGIIILDNVLWSGKVLSKNMDREDDSTQALSKLNEWIRGNPQLDGVLLPIRDGIFLVRPKDSARLH